MLVSFIPLVIAICSAWISEPRIFAKWHLPPPWLLLLVLSTGMGLTTGVLAPISLLWIAVLLAVAYLGGRPDLSCWQRRASYATLAAVALALGLHKLPGFHNPVLLSGIKFSSDSARFTLYANFDKGVVGLVLLALVCRRSSSWHELVQIMKKSAPVAGITTTVCFMATLALQFAHVDLKIPHVTLLFLVVNLFLTVIAEEVFFRGFVQEQLTIALSNYRWNNAIAIGVSAMTFGAAHGAGGSRYALLAALAGLGYALSYQQTRRIESSIATHFIVNTVDFLMLSYPYLQQGHTG